MDQTTYQRLRQRLGTQQDVAAELSVDRGTLIRRESGGLPITREAELALTCLAQTRLMKPFYYSAPDGTPAVGEYGCFPDGSKILIVARGDLLSNHSHSRDSALNHILIREFPGIRTDFLRFVTVVGPDSSPLIQEFDIEPTSGDSGKKIPVVRQKELLRRRHEILSEERVPSALPYTTDFEKARTLKNYKDGLPILELIGLR